MVSFRICCEESTGVVNLKKAVYTFSVLGNPFCSQKQRIRGILVLYATNPSFGAYLYLDLIFFEFHPKNYEAPEDTTSNNEFGKTFIQSPFVL